MFSDVARAFFEAEATRYICIELPDEDKTEEDWAEDNVGLLVNIFYGTRDAAVNWQDEVARYLKKLGFARGRSNPCLYYHRQWDVQVLVHGDGFVSVGDRERLKDFRRKLDERFEMKTVVVGLGQDEER